MDRPWLIGVIAACLLATVVPARVAAGQDVASLPGDPPQRHRDHVFTATTATMGIEYGQSVTHGGSLEPRLADVYEPAGDTAARRPLMIWMHGGGFTAGNRGSMASFATDSARRGWVGATISYRLRPGLDIGNPANWREALGAIAHAGRDAQMAVRYFRANADDYGIDPDIIAVGGYSAGAIASLWANFNDAGAQTESSEVTASVSLAGAIYFGQPPAGTAPFYMFHGERDPTVPYDLAVTTCNKQIDNGNVCELVTYDTTHLLSPWYDEIRDRAAARLYDLATCGLELPDIDADQPSCAAVDWMMTGGVARGWPDDTYRPDRLVTRQAAVSFLWNQASSPPTGGHTPYRDVPGHHPFLIPIAWATDQAVAAGFPDGSFRPTDAVTRQAMVALLWRRAGSPTGAPDPGFVDVDGTHPFREAIAWAAQHGVIDAGGEGAALAPQEPITRREAAMLVYDARAQLPSPTPDVEPA